MPAAIALTMDFEFFLGPIRHRAIFILCATDYDKSAITAHDTGRLIIIAGIVALGVFIVLIFVAQSRPTTSPKSGLRVPLQGLAISALRHPAGTRR